jgi:hypothetical protein
LASARKSANSLLFSFLDNHEKCPRLSEGILCYLL